MNLTNFSNFLATNKTTKNVQNKNLFRQKYKSITEKKSIRISIAPQSKIRNSKVKNKEKENQKEKEKEKEKEIYIKKFEMNLPNFNHIKIKYQILNK
jgi:hypothetical protein